MIELLDFWADWCGPCKQMAPNINSIEKLYKDSKGDLCKFNLYNKFIKDKYNVLAVFEDSKKCVDMWRREGLLCLQPNSGLL